MCEGECVFYKIARNILIVQYLVLTNTHSKRQIRFDQKYSLANISNCILNMNVIIYYRAIMIIENYVPSAGFCR